ncbi:hypothetical protein HK096_007044, partial [Nowakowskiella sp. JEL0078]
STYRVLLIFPEIQYLVTLQLSGLRSPTVRKDVPGTEDLVEPFGEEAKYFVEARLLHRDVTVILEGVSGNNFVGTVKFPAGNIAEALLGEGLARVVDWSIPLVTGGGGKLRTAEIKAKEKKIRLWKDYIAKQRINHQKFEGTVTKIISADLIQVLSGDKERKIAISSIRVPKPKEPKESGYNFDAREFLRTKLIGKKVQVAIDYIKPAQADFEERECATVKIGDVNIGEQLVSKGLAGVIRYKKDDDNRSSAYDQLLVAEDKAIKATLGIHSGKDKSAPVQIDASENITKATQYFSTLLKADTISGVVEFVSSGSRFKVWIPSQKIKITLVLGGIRCPRAGRPGEQSEPFGLEALEYANRKVLQRDVEISVEGQDKVGGFIGSLFLTGRHNFAVLLANAGLAEVHEYSAKSSKYGKELLSAGVEAKAARKGIWSLKDPYPIEVVTEIEAPVESSSLPIAREAVVSDIVGGSYIYLQYIGEETKRLEKLMVDFDNFHRNLNVPSHIPKGGELVSAKFTADNNWYRGRVQKVTTEGNKKLFQILYIDYGNTETVSSDHIRTLDSKFNTTALPAQAIESEFAYLNMPKRDADYGEDLFDHLREILEDVKLESRTVPKLNLSGINSVLLYDPKVSQTESINERLVLEGLATVAKAHLKRHEKIKAEGKQTSPVLEKLIHNQEEAKKNRAGMWRY